MADLSSWSGVGSQILQRYLRAETGLGAGDAGNFGLDVFANGFEDEFPSDNDDPVGGTYISYSPEANRAQEARPWGQSFGDRPKVHELNQPPAAQALGWRVIDLYPNRDIKHEFYRLAGTPSELRLLMQMVQLVRAATGNRIDFKDWFEKWEAGFPDFSDNRSIGNFQLGGQAAWRSKPESRPRYREWTSSQQRADLGYRTIEYWPDRSAESASYVLSGSDVELIRHIIQIEYEGGGASGGNRKGEVVARLKGQPLITLYFSQESAQATGKTPVTAEVSFRIMDRTDDPKSSLNKISSNDLKLYAQRIKEQFSGPPTFSYEKGRRVVSYRNRYQGFASWYLVNSKLDGIELIKRMLAVTGQTINLSYVKYSQTEDEESAYPLNPGIATVLGEQVELEAERPIVKVIFQRATIQLSKLAKPITLVERARIVYT